MHRIAAATAVASLPLGILAQGLVGAPAQAAGVAHIGFEDAPGFCLFSHILPLRNRYAAARFRGPVPGAGGGVLDSTCGGWSQTAHKGERFLAFNDDARYAGGGEPIGPQRITFPKAKKLVSIWVSQASTSGETATFTLFGRKNLSVVRKHTVSVSSNDWVRLYVRRRAGMNNVVLRADVEPDGTWLADDLLMRNK